jgi:hypothetical protein
MVPAAARGGGPDPAEWTEVTGPGKGAASPKGAPRHVLRTSLLGGAGAFTSSAQEFGTHASLSGRIGRNLVMACALYPCGLRRR